MTTNRIVFIAFADVHNIPDWVIKLRGNEILHEEGIIPYMAGSNFSDNMVSNAFMEVLSGSVAPRASKYMEALKLDPMLYDPPQSESGVLTRILQADTEAAIDRTFKELYVLMRSSAVLVDMNAADDGAVSQPVLYAHLLEIPVFGVGYKYLNSPWIMDKVTSFTSPKTTDQIVITLKGYLDTVGAIQDKRVGFASKVEQKAAEEPQTDEPGTNTVP